MDKCTVENCNKRHIARGFCYMHYARFRGYNKESLYAPARRVWSTKEIELLKKTYKKEYVDLYKLSKKLKRERSNICRKAKELKLSTSYNRKVSPTVRVNSMMKKPKQFSFIKLNYDKISNPNLAKITGYSVSGIGKISAAWGFDEKDKKEQWQRSPHPRGMKGKHHNKKTKQIISKTFKKMWADSNSYVNSKEYRQLCSDRCVKLQKEGKLRNRYSRCRSGKRKDLNNLFVRSSWEANYARYLNFLKKYKNILKWEYEADTFYFEKIKRGTRFYTPDFKVWENNGDIKYHEVKGWMTQKGQTALDRMKKYYPEITIILIDKPVYMEISKWKNVIPNWE